MRGLRTGHAATLLADGAVLLEGGTGEHGQPVAPELVFPEQPAVVPAVGFAEPASDPAFAGSAPVDGAQDVSAAASLVVRFTGPVPLAHGAARAFTLSAGAAQVPIQVVAAEGGRLFFVHPLQALEPGTPHILTAGPFATGTGTDVPGVAIVFTTRQREADQGAPEAEEDERWVPGATPGSPWESGRPPSSWAQLPPLEGPSGVTALAGQILVLNGKPLPGVEVRFTAPVNFVKPRIATGRADERVDKRR